jgi:hypothetical protein
MTLLQSSPEIRELDLNAFRLELKDLEDGLEGMPFLKTHNHNTEVTLSGLTYARIVEVLDPYTVEFENAQYTVSCTGANHNLADVKVANQVSLIINNAAGLITNAAIQFGEYEGAVTVDISNTTGNATDGSIYPVGTLRRPVDNFSDALVLAAARGFDTLNIIGDASIDTGLDYSDLQFVGESPQKTTLTVSASANVTNCEFYNATVTGTLDGNAVLRNCSIGTLNYVYGEIHQCILTDATITLGGSSAAYFLDCWSGVPGTGTPEIDMGGSGQALNIRNYNGGIELSNKSGTDNVSIDLNSGHVVLASDVTNGTILIRGVGKVTDNSVGATVIDETVNVTNVWAYER